MRKYRNKSNKNLKKAKVIRIWTSIKITLYSFTGILNCPS